MEAGRINRNLHDIRDQAANPITDNLWQWKSRFTRKVMLNRKPVKYLFPGGAIADFTSHCFAPIL
jgi:hypothetical protein